ncbi:hypothetical protein [Paracidovorax wautersii]|uniref:hypothetical protein n=1 Tax=Paracidovorax wautersii TaxID=1177982 RepID=UPI0011144B8D|nr:hypothetical protein [Paracidovorax wautersii]
MLRHGSVHFPKSSSIRSAKWALQVSHSSSSNESIVAHLVRDGVCQFFELDLRHSQAAVAAALLGLVAQEDAITAWLKGKRIIDFVARFNPLFNLDHPGVDLGARLLGVGFIGHRHEVDDRCSLPCWK